MTRSSVPRISTDSNMQSSGATKAVTPQATLIAQGELERLRELLPLVEACQGLVKLKGELPPATVAPSGSPVPIVVAMAPVDWAIVMAVAPVGAPIVMAVAPVNWTTPITIAVPVATQVDGFN